MKSLISMIIGGAVGFFVMYFALAADITVDFSSVAFEFTIVLFGIAILLIGFIVINVIKMSRKVRLELDGDEEDEREVWQYKRFSDSMLSSTIFLVISISAAAVSLLTDQPIWMMITAIVAVLAAFVLSIAVSGMIKKLYPARDLPNVSEKNYAKKLLAASDEGERHVMLEGLYRSFNTVNSTLVVALLVLIVYSLITGVSQLFAIFIVGIVLITANTQYTLVIRNKS